MRVLAGIVVVLAIVCTSHAQQDSTATDLSSYFTFDPDPFLGYLLPYFPPYLWYYGDQLKDFIRGDTLAMIRSRLGDRRAVDAIFVRAMKLTSNNTSMALLISCFGTFDHQIVGLRAPVLSLFFPLTGESMDDFEARRKKLPSKLFTDSPRGRAGDRDKLQHFFGSAFLAYTFESRDVANRFGESVEYGEDAIVIDGTLDERDMRANRLGQDFGLALLSDPHQYPSEFLNTWLARGNEPRDSSQDIKEP